MTRASAPPALVIGSTRMGNRQRIRNLGVVVIVPSVIGLLVSCDPHTRSDIDPGKFFNIGGAEYLLENPGTDPSVSTESNTEGSGEVYPGDSLSLSIGFNAPNGNVIGGGIAFGDPDDIGIPGAIQVVPVPGAGGQTSGMMNITIDVPDDICSNLSQICHDIRCYEFAVTSAGQVSAADINDLALACGGCEEPSCQELLTSCENPGEECPGGCGGGQQCVNGICVGAGALAFTMTWDVATDLDIHVQTPGGSEIYYGNPSADGGTLDQDDIPGGAGSVENIFFASMPAGGNYTYWIENLGPASSSFTLRVTENGQQVAIQNGNLAVGVDSTMYNYTY
jgi:hypothetical protein